MNNCMNCRYEPDFDLPACTGTWRGGKGRCKWHPQEAVPVKTNNLTYYGPMVYIIDGFPMVEHVSELYVHVHNCPAWLPREEDVTLQVYSGKPFYPLIPKPEDIDLEDIAHSLAMTVRYRGHCKIFYSVAEHSVRMAELYDYFDIDPKEALFHDAAEAYLCDMPSPLKPAFPGFKALEERILSVIAERFGLQPEFWKNVKQADMVMRATEKRDVMKPSTFEWGSLSAPFPERITPWNWQYAERRFIECAWTLGIK